MEPLLSDWDGTANWDVQISGVEKPPAIFPLKFPSCG